MAEASSTSGNILGTPSRIRAAAVTATAVTAASSATDENVIITLRGIMKVNAAGTITPQVQFSTSPGGTALVVSNSYIKFTPLGTSAVASIGNWS